VLYATSLALGCLIVADRLAAHGRSSFARLGRACAWGLWAAAALDGLENGALIATLFGQPDPWAAVATACAVPKFAIVALALLIFLPVGGLRVLLDGRPGRPAASGADKDRGRRED